MAKSKQVILTTSILAAVALSRNLFIGFDGAVCGAGAKALGVIAEDTPAGEYAPVDTDGITLVIAGGAVDAGTAVKSDADGKAVAATAVTVALPAGETAVTSDAADPTLVVGGGYLPEAVNGFALDDATQAGEIIRIRLV